MVLIYGTLTIGIPMAFGKVPSEFLEAGSGSNQKPEAKLITLPAISGMCRSSVPVTDEINR